MRSLLSLSALALAMSTGPALAFSLTDVTTSHLPAPAQTGRNTMDIGAADLDGDGDLDLVLPQEFFLNRILINDGQGRFSEAGNRLQTLNSSELAGGPPLPGHDSEDVSIADFDGDGRLDIVIVSEDDVRFSRSGVHEYYRGTAEGRFERVRGVLPDTEANAVAHADLNGDGRDDLLIVGAGQDRLLINDGQGGFGDETGQRLPREAATGQDAEFADLDGDGDLDLILGLEGGHALWINDGQGVFTDETAQRLPDPGNVEARKVAPADVDGDGDLDLYFSHVGWQGRAPQDRLLINDGTGRFTDETAARIPSEALTTLDGRFADLDGDGDLDLIQAHAERLTVLENDGTGVFSDVTAEVLGEVNLGGPSIAIEIADFNGDGVMDLYVGQLAGGQNNPNARDRLLLGSR